MSIQSSINRAITAGSAIYAAKKDLSKKQGKTPKATPAEETLKKPLTNNGSNDLMSKANLQAKQKKKNKIEQKRRFKDYLAKMQTNFGGTIGDLPDSVQKAIAKQYSPYERQKIMNAATQKKESK